jgi:hypothetical protein
MNHQNNKINLFKDLDSFRKSCNGRKLVSSLKKERPRRIEIIRPPTSVFITGGIGDVIAVESFLTDQERQSIKNIFYATNKRIFLEPLVNSLNTFVNLEKHISLWDDFSQFWCFFSLQDYINKTKSQKNSLNLNLKTCKDLSIFPVISDIQKGLIQYNESSFLKDKLASIDEFNLPDEYFIILPYSTDKRTKTRDFNANDWEQIVIMLQKSQTYGVVINLEKEFVPSNEFIIDLSEKTELTQAIEILKRAKGYFGIDSWMSVLAAKLFDIPFLQVKSKNNHCMNNAAFYYAPKTNFNFIVPAIIST